MTNSFLAIVMVALFLLPGCGIFGGTTDGMKGFWEVDPVTACSIVLAEAEAEAGITYIGTKIMIDGVAYLRQGDCSTVEIEMFKTANRL